MAELSNSLHLRYCIHVVCPQPQRSKLHWFGLFRVRSPLLTESNFFLFLRVLRCFSSPGCLRRAYVFSARRRGMAPAGFAHSEIHGSSGYVLLTVAYRSLSRPSSASCAKASTVCPYHLLLDGSVHTYTPAASRSPVRSDAIFLKKKNIVFVTLCSSQGTARASPRDRTLRALARRKASAGTDGHRLVCDDRFCG